VRRVLVGLATAIALGIVATAGSGATALKVTVTAPGHTPKTATHWNYTVTARVAGKLVAGRISEQIVDPIGGAHPVTFGSGTKPITNLPFKGTFKDYIVWPASSRGIPLTLRITVKAGGSKRVVSYPVTPR
jgi:hypothetical protein